MQFPSAWGSLAELQPSVQRRVLSSKQKHRLWQRRDLSAPRAARFIPATAAEPLPGSAVSPAAAAPTSTDPALSTSRLPSSAQEGRKAPAPRGQRSTATPRPRGAEANRAPADGSGGPARSRPPQAVSPPPPGRPRLPPTGATGAFRPAPCGTAASPAAAAGGIPAPPRQSPSRLAAAPLRAGGGGGHTQSRDPPLSQPAPRESLVAKSPTPEARRAPSNAAAPPTDVMETSASAARPPVAAAEGRGEVWGHAPAGAVPIGAPPRHLSH
ncbi:nematocyst expressed protein 3-like [Pezoporus flaviventris]|uniref:nematocyst expressed protein 3-like n=1 Tax=Pezoporus flaviventris TaxID=889875 RepID=UPI002AB05858|nr:nematocyst expressed protein 3-like [Pezoporus flaviventris]